MQSDKIFIRRSLFIHGQRQGISSWKVSAQWVIKLPKEIRGIWKKQTPNYLCLNKRCDATSRTITAKQIQSAVTKPCSYLLMKVIHHIWNHRYFQSLFLWKLTNKKKRKKKKKKTSEAIEQSMPKKQTNPPQILADSYFRFQGGWG